MGFLSAAAGIAGIAQAGLGVFQAIKGDEDLEDAQRAAQKQAEQDTRGLEFRLEAAKAQQDPTHPWFLALRDSRRDINQRLFQSGIEDFMRSHRRNLAIGGPGSIVAPDRRDENLFRAFGRQRATYDPAAEARSILATAGGTTGGSAGGAAVAGNLAQSQRDVESGGIANIFAGINNAQSLEDLLGGQASGQPSGFSRGFANTPEIRQAAQTGPLQTGPR